MVSSLFEGLHKYLYGEDFSLKVQGDFVLWKHYVYNIGNEKENIRIVRL
jgi:hypothetical protein